MFLFVSVRSADRSTGREAQGKEGARATGPSDHQGRRRRAHSKGRGDQGGEEGPQTGRQGTKTRTPHREEDKQAGLQEGKGQSALTVEQQHPAGALAQTLIPAASFLAFVRNIFIVIKIKMAC